jgi:hypothetical protein
MTQLSVPCDQVGVPNACVLTFPSCTFTESRATVSITDGITHVCAFVTDHEEATRRITQEVGADFL